MTSLPDTSTATGQVESEARRRILDTAYELFSRRGIRAVGTNEIILRAGVARATLYRHFASKGELVLAFLEDREHRWAEDLVQAGARERASTPEGQLLAIFDVFDDWFHQQNFAVFDGCSFVNVLLELGSDDPAGRAAIGHIEQIRLFVRDLAEQAGLRDPDRFSRSWRILMKGSIIASTVGDDDAAQLAKQMASRLIEDHRP